jgi:hypothetical protein
MAGFQTGKRDYADGSSTYPFVVSVATGNFLVELKAFEALVRADERNKQCEAFQQILSSVKAIARADEREACLHAATVAISLCDDPVAAIRNRGNT